MKSARLLFSLLLLCLLASPALAERELRLNGSLTAEAQPFLKHSQANALTVVVAPAAGVTANGATMLVAQLRNNVTDNTTTLAATQINNPTGRGP